MNPTIKIDKNLNWWIKKGGEYEKQPNKITFNKAVEIQVKANVCSAGKFKKKHI